MKGSRTRADAARTIIRAVNAQDAELYVSVCAENVVVKIYDGPVRVTGRQTLQENRARHFALYPQIRAEIQHLVEIGDVVIMHDRVWLSPGTQALGDIVEIFTFDDEGLIGKIDLVQPPIPVAR